MSAPDDKNTNDKDKTTAKRSRSAARRWDTDVCEYFTEKEGRRGGSSSGGAAQRVLDA